METALEDKEGPVVGGDAAGWIESCVCPTGYAGLSCQVNVQTRCSFACFPFTCVHLPSFRTAPLDSSVSRRLSCQPRVRG